MSAEDNPDNKEGAEAADDPFAGWAEALEEQKSADAPPGDAEQGGPLSGEPVRPFTASGSDGTTNDINMVLDIPVQLSVELGRTKVPIKYILQLAQGLRRGTGCTGRRAHGCAGQRLFDRTGRGGGGE